MGIVQNGSGTRGVLEIEKVGCTCPRMPPVGTGNLHRSDDGVGIHSCRPFGVSAKKEGLSCAKSGRARKEVRFLYSGYETTCNGGRGGGVFAF